MSAAAVVDGAAAHVLDRLLRHSEVRRLLDALPVWLRGELAETHRALERAAAAYVARPVAEAGTAVPGLPEIVAASAPEDLLTVAEVAGLIGRSERRVRQLAAAGLGVKRAGAWLIPRSLAEIVREDRRGA